jgi:hypothetical protein
LNTRVLGGPKGVNGLPSGHSNLNSSNPGLLKDFPRGILVIKMLSASLCPKKVEDKTAKDVKRLSDVGEASYMVPLDSRGVIASTKRFQKRCCCEQKEGHQPNELNLEMKKYTI